MNTKDEIAYAESEAHAHLARIDYQLTERAQLMALGDNAVARFEVARERKLRAGGMGTVWPSADDD